MAELKSTRDGYGQGLVEAANSNDQLVVLTADLAKSTRSHWFAKAFPQRFFECGIAEQNMVGIAAGLALSGKIPFVSSYAAFSPGRSWEQIRLSVCYQQANVKISGHHAGLQTGPDGVSQQGTEDIAMMRVLPNLTILAPADYQQAKLATIAAANHQGPVYLRLNKYPVPALIGKHPFKIGQAQVLKKGTDATLIACGPLVHQALMAAKTLAQEKIKVEVINNSTIKPLDIDTILASVQKTHCLVTAEDHQIIGGMGSAIVETLAQVYAAPVTEMIGLRDTFGQSGLPDQLYHQYGLDSLAIIRAIKKVINRKHRL